MYFHYSIWVGNCSHSPHCTDTNLQIEVENYFYDYINECIYEIKNHTTLGFCHDLLNSEKVICRKIKCSEHFTFSSPTAKTEQHFQSDPAATDAGETLAVLRLSKRNSIRSFLSAKYFKKLISKSGSYNDVQ